MNVTIIKHELIKTGTEGNGFHGVCKHCGASLESWLGYSGWSKPCIKRPIDSYMDIPIEIRDYALFRGLIYNKDKNIFIKPYSNDRYTIQNLKRIIKQCKH